MKNLNCNIIKDLLPSYIDKISSDETNKLVKEHLDSCKDCYSIFKKMRKDVDNELIDSEFEQLDYLKKYKINKMITVLFAITLTLCIVIFSVIFYKSVLTTIPLPVYLEDIQISSNTSIYSNNSPTFTFYFYSNKSNISVKADICYDERGNKVLCLRAYSHFSLERPSQSSYTIREIDLKNDNISKVYLEDTAQNLKQLWPKF